MPKARLVLLFMHTFPMMLVFSSAATSLDTRFGGATPIGSGSDYMVSWIIGVPCPGGAAGVVFFKLAVSCESGLCTCCAGPGC